MIFHPIAPLLALVFGLASLGMLGAGAFLIWEYARGAASASALCWGAGLVAFSAFGRYFFLALLGRRTDEPLHLERSSDSLVVERPDRVRLHVETFGPADAPILLLTHGFGQDSTSWGEIKRLSEQYRVVVWDLRGTGYSTRPRSRDYSMEAMAEDLHAVINRFTPGAPMLLAGYGLGGMITLTLLRTAGRHFHQRISGLALINTPAVNPVRACRFCKLSAALRRPLIQPILRLSIWFSPFMRLQNWLMYSNGTLHLLAWLFGFTGRPSRAQLTHAAKLAVRSQPAAQARRMRSMLRYDATDTLGRIEIPTVVLAGSEDPTVAPTASEALHQSLRNAQLVSIERAGSRSVEQHGKAVARTLAEFAKKVLPPSRELNRAA